MKTQLFIANIVSAILLLNFAFNDPSLTGFAVAPTKTTLDLTSPLGFAIIFIVTIIALDIYFYVKSRKE